MGIAKTTAAAGIHHPAVLRRADDVIQQLSGRRIAIFGAAPLKGHWILDAEWLLWSRSNVCYGSKAAIRAKPSWAK
jgi:hypothetical protein